MERFSATPRQADLMIVAGRVSQKMAPVLRQVYDQMAEPKWVLAMGVCASSGGMFNNYAIVQGVDHVVPVDIYLPGCPPRPEMLLNAILMLHDKIARCRWASTATRRSAKPSRRRWRPRPPSSSRACCGERRMPTARAPRKSSACAAACSGQKAPATPPATAAWSARSRCRAARRGPTAVISTRSSTAWRAVLGDEGPDSRRGRRAGGGVPRRADPGSQPRAPAGGGAGAARRPGTAVRAVPGGHRRALPRTTPAGNCTRSIR